MKFKLRVYTGPVQVAALAEKCREAGLQVTVEGTEHLHLLVPGTDVEDAKYAFQRALLDTHVTTFGLRARAL